MGEDDKRKFAATFVNAYGKKAEDNPYVGELLLLLPAGTLTATETRAAMSGPQVPKPRLAAGKVGVQWVTIPGGMFLMGSNDGGSDEKPVHQVTVTSFQIAKTEVTVEQYKACVDVGACKTPDRGGYCTWGAAGKANHPMNCVDWNEAKIFSEWAGGRLPTEAEWEYAARDAGKDQKYPWGNADATCESAVISKGRGGDGCGKDSTWPACSKTKGNTDKGLCDMAGNVFEWVQDWYHDSYNDAPVDGSAWEIPAGGYRVIRGGSWDNDASHARSAYRNDFGVAYRRYNGLGFRPARSVP